MKFDLRRAGDGGLEQHGDRGWLALALIGGQWARKL
jgi:hypothetical protein